jgi:CheY-like chemotaxis protein
VSQDIVHTSEPGCVPPAGLEPAHPAPEAGALSAELRGLDGKSSNAPSVTLAEPGAGGYRPTVDETPKPRILAVDDDPVILRLLQVNFRLEGYDVVTASRGDEAIRLAREQLPEVIVLDVMMPGIDGYEVCRALKEDPTTAGAPVIFLSARAQDADRDQGYALGVVAYVTKPFDPAQLVDVVRRALTDAGPG